jgi:lysozyme family protein
MTYRTPAFAAALDFVLLLERGKYDGSGAHDPNRTKDGVIQSTYDKHRRVSFLPERDVYLMSREERDEIYWGFYTACHADELPVPLQPAHFAFAINASPAVAVRALQRALNEYAELDSDELEEDGRYGSLTDAAVTDIFVRINSRLFLATLLLEQLRFYRDICRPPSKAHLRPNMVSWSSRLLSAWDRV